MAGRLHQTLLLWAARRMTADGIVVAGFDGAAEGGGFFNSLPAPFALRGRRPDAWGAREDGTLIAFAEVKSATDVSTGRTIGQLRIFGNVRMKNGSICPLYVAVPRDAAPALELALRAAGLASARNVVRIHIPEILLTEASRAA
jgi:hypothetical protein